ncbi:LysR family transcriptional regulator [Gottfriedia acidiceleris]|uniref:LysR family transcriptional regulator n=1 Tax=Gottfriedia acidiceleris TaxID=371036 RepID=A0ABY4JP57_9BACI|nr:LysR family transcriptional regulator [Gottfriedia acidiceleris]UPM55221.1 LysR family transcriptional regulator [Gottfriedia acidiceleris]
MRIEQLLYITEIAKTGSIANTSERLYVSSPGISLAISGLEEELGVKIFERYRTGLEPTEIGKRLIIKAQRILNSIEEFKLEAKSDSSDIEGLISISAVTSLCKGIIPKASAKLKSKFPGITLEIKETGPSQVRKDVLNGKADIGLTFNPFPSGKENQMLISTHLLDSRMMICFRKDSNLAKLNQINIEDILKQPLALSFKNSNGKDKYFSQLFGEHDNFNIQIQSQNSDTRKYFIAEGLAVSFEPELTAKFDPFYRREDIIVKPVLGLDSKMSYYCIRLKNQHYSAASQAFMKELNLQVNSLKKEQ